jgi:Icc-related predicted phosphoesterase
MTTSKLLRRAAFVALAASISFTGCKQKQAEAPTPAPEAAQEKQAAGGITAEQLKPVPQAEVDCAAPVELGPVEEVKIGDRAAKRAGSKLTFEGEATGKLVLGVLGPVNEDSGENLVALEKYLEYFKEQKVEAIVLTGDVAETDEGIARVLRTVARAGVPVLTVIGNRECRTDYADGVLEAQKETSNIVNLNQIRQVSFPQATLVSLPGYHDLNYMSCAAGCQYFKSTVDEVVRAARESTTPVVLVSHGPPRGEGSQALDYAISGGNVGDSDINRAIEEGKIAFGLFSNIKEAGARAVDNAQGTALVNRETPSKTLYLNPGPADTHSWAMNDGTRSVGMAATFTIEDGKASWNLFRAKPLTTAEKARAKALEQAAQMAADSAP